jgi:hypothetical protein
LGEVTSVGIRDDAPGLITQRKLRVTEEGVVGGGNEPTCHLQNGISGSGRDASGQFLSFGFQFGGQRFGHDDLRPV